MNSKSCHNPANRRVRLLVGLMLAAMIGILCGRYVLSTSGDLDEPVAAVPVQPVVEPIIEPIVKAEPQTPQPVGVAVTVAKPAPQVVVEPKGIEVTPAHVITVAPAPVAVAPKPQPVVAKPAPARPEPAPKREAFTLPLVESTAVASQGPLKARAKAQAVDQIERWAQNDHITLLKHCLEHYRRNYSSYTVRLTKQERLRGKLGKQQVLDVKFMPQPFSVAMAWVQNSGDGDRMLYVDGKYNNKMVVRPASTAIRWLIPSVTVKLDDKAVKAASLRTVDQFGFENGLRELLKFYEQAAAAGELRQEFGGYANVNDRRTVKLIRYLPAKDNYPAARTEIYIDTEYLVPVAIAGYGWETPAELLCSYTYTNINFDALLTAEDFLPINNGIKGRK